MGHEHGNLIQTIKKVAKLNYGLDLRTNTVGRARMASGWHQVGLGTGSSDLIGSLPLYGPKGLRIAQFCAVEVKIRGDCPSTEQQGYLDYIEARGGAAFVVWSIEDFIEEMSRHVLLMANHGLKLYVMRDRD